MFSVLLYLGVIPMPHTLERVHFTVSKSALSICTRLVQLETKVTALICFSKHFNSLTVTEATFLGAIEETEA